MGRFILAIIEGLAALIALHGFLRTTFAKESGFVSSIHNSMWFLFTMASNTFGVASLLMELWEDFTKEEGSNPSMRPLHLLQYHYFFAWLGILVGYAGIVTQMWMVYYPLRLSHMHLAIIGVPMIAWLKRKTTAIVVTTQFITIITTVSHAYISFVASNYWGLGGSFLMGLQILSMSLPLRYSFLFSDFSTREVAILFSAANSFLFTKSIEQAAKFPKIYRSA